MITFERKPDEIYIELSREAKMGKVDADRTLFMNRLRNRIRNEIIDKYDLGSLSSTQQRAAVERVLLCVQQGAESAVCPLCGKHDGLTPREAATGADCQVAHIIPSGAGGDNRYSNKVLAHAECNQRMKRRTPRQFWEADVKGGFDEGMRWIENIYGDIQRIKPSETKTVTGIELWKCYFTQPAKRGDVFTKQDDRAKIEQFKKDIKDIQGMTSRQEASTKYAARQVMAYLADALYDGKGLPERGGVRRIYTTDGLWTSRLRREWGLFFDPHGRKAKGLTNQQDHQRKEKDRGDHRHHGIDAVVIALSWQEVKNAWEEREKRAEKDGINTADEEAMENYRRRDPVRPPSPFDRDKDLREAVRRAVFTYPEGPDWLRRIFTGKEVERPVCHRPVKRKLIGALHKETLFGVVLDSDKKLTSNYTARKNVLELDANHLRLPVEEPRKDALKRITAELKSQGLKPNVAKQKAEAILSDPDYKPRMVEPPPRKPGIVRDVNLRRILREQIPKRHREVREKLKQQLSLEADEKRRKDVEKALERLDQSIDLDKTGDAAKKKFQRQLKIILNDGPICMPSGVPIHSVILLRTMSDPVIASRWATYYESGQRYKVYDAITGKGDATRARAYDSQNNHHIEIRIRTDRKGKDIWSGTVLTAFEVAQQLRMRLRKLNALEKPYRHLRRRLTKDQRKGLSKDQLDQLSRRRLREWKQALRGLRPQRTKILNAHPLVDRSDNEHGRFVMSLCEGEMLLMKHKPTGEVGYFVVAKLEKPHNIVLVPHWDARSATGRKDADGKKVADSKRDQFSVTPTDLKKLAPPGHPHAIKVRVGPLGDVVLLEHD
jgi:hypothetical protein